MFQNSKCEDNNSYLEGVPFRYFHDLAITYYVLVQRNTDGIGTIPIQNCHMELWGVEETDSWELAYKNTKELFPISIKTMEQIICELTGRHYESDNPSKMYVISNNHKHFGAASIIYKEILHDFAEKKNANFFILPSSIHECILLVDDGEMSKHELDDMVQEINNTQVDAEEVLSHSMDR